MISLDVILATFALISVLLLTTNPNIECTRERDVLLWYYWQNERKYIKLFKL